MFRKSVHKPTLVTIGSAGLLGKYVKYTTFVTFFTFSLNRPGGQTPESIFTQNDLNDVDSRVDVQFEVKSKLFLTRDPQAPKIAKIWHF